MYVYNVIEWHYAMDMNALELVSTILLALQKYIVSSYILLNEHPRESLHRVLANDTYNSLRWYHDISKRDKKRILNLHCADIPDNTKYLKSIAYCIEYRLYQARAISVIQTEHVLRDILARQCPLLAFSNTPYLRSTTDR